MCRMLGFVSPKKVSAEEFYPYVNKMAKEGKHAPHGDGFGVCAVDNEKIYVYKEINPIWERKRDFANIRGYVGIIHARKASWMKSTILCTHPFVRKFYCFAHNGKIEDFKEKCDSWEFFKLILREGMNGLKSIKKATSLTFLLTRGKSLTATRYSLKNEDYYTLYEGRLGHAVVISSEDLGGFREIENFTSVTYRIENGEIIRRERKL